MASFLIMTFSHQMERLKDIFLEYHKLKSKKEAYKRNPDKPEKKINDNTSFSVLNRSTER